MLTNLYHQCTLPPPKKFYMIKIYIFIIYLHTTYIITLINRYNFTIIRPFKIILFDTFVYNSHQAISQILFLKCRVSLLIYYSITLVSNCTTNKLIGSDVQSSQVICKNVFFFTSICEASKLSLWENQKLKGFLCSQSMASQSILLNKQGIWVSFKHVVPGM